MAEQQLPVWNSEGIEPPANLQIDGWQPGVKPPAQYFDWLFNRAYKCLEELQAITEALETDKANGDDLTTLNNKVTQHLDEYGTFKDSVINLPAINVLSNPTGFAADSFVHYEKDVVNKVSINIYMVKQEDFTAGQAITLGQLPVGFRPSVTVTLNAMLYTNAGVLVPNASATILIHSNGNIIMHTMQGGNFTNARRLYGASLHYRARG